MPFNAKAATLLPQIYQQTLAFIDWAESLAEVYDPYILEAIKESVGEIPTYQLIDMRPVMDAIDSDYFQIMLDDMLNSGELRLPYDRCALWLIDSKVGFLKKCEDREEIPGGYESATGFVSDNVDSDRLAFIPATGRIVHGDLQQVFINDIYAGLFNRDERFKEIETDAMATHSAAAVLAFLLKHKKIEIADITVPLRRNAKRQKHGKLPYCEYKQIAFTRTITRRDTAKVQRGDYTPQRFHVRAGHWRHLASGKKTWVRAYCAGDLSRGCIIKDYTINV